ncbi:nitrogenase molybdenum-iron protein NifN [Propionibacterium cyclohexanicum]|uniref:Nitrogenase molybdenum-iron protein NifN n=1 Tax=Propionibacterium cyclohexanicum TaxID=64702 RepID=A0A1H9TZH0_9ACTN|nr:nitrogenase component 1 [Propionibacterium cyclohexanicum]SES02361.1 nitrogenase molybdenum-iron protein NifN [Propionibacterium cyclohexanicum]
MSTDQARAPLADQDKTPARQRAKVATTNACRMCMPLGACLAYTGFEGVVPFLHGSQGCSTYIRRYLISHFAEPMDIASSSVGESATIFGGESNLRTGVANVTRVYKPFMIGIASTCLTETIGEDVAAMITRLKDPVEGMTAKTGVDTPELVFAHTPSYSGTHADGYHAAVREVVRSLAEPGETGSDVNLFPGICSAADLRHLKELVSAYGLGCNLMPDYSERLDGVTVARYEKLPAGGTTADQVRAAGHAKASITLGGLVTPGVQLAGELLHETFQVPHHMLAMPIGIRLTDMFTELLGQLSGRPMPEWLVKERGRLVDAYIDGHKYAMDRKAIVFGDEDLVTGLASFCAEIGITPVLIATGGRSGHLAREIGRLNPELDGKVEVLDDGDFEEITARANELRPDIMIGHSKGYTTARDLGIPLVRVGLPIHDRVGGQRVKHLGYRGTQELFDRVINALIAARQDESPIGYAYM